jgi:hypothetical protein
LAQRRTVTRTVAALRKTLLPHRGKSGRMARASVPGTLNRGHLAFAEETQKRAPPDLMPS